MLHETSDMLYFTADYADSLKKVYAVAHRLHNKPATFTELSLTFQPSFCNGVDDIDIASLSAPSDARALELDAEVAQYANTLGTSHAERLAAVALQLETVVFATVSIEMSPNFKQHQEMMRLLLGILPSHIEVTLIFRLGDATDAAGWTVLATTLAQLNIIDMLAFQGTPPALVTAAVTPTLTNLYLEGAFDSVDWQPLQRCPLEHLSLQGYANQAVLDNIASSLKRLHLHHSKADDVDSLVIPSQAVDSNTVVSMRRWYKLTTFPPKASVSCYYTRGIPPTAAAPLNVPIRLLDCDDHFLRCCPALFNTVQSVMVSQDTLQAPLNTAFSNVLAVSLVLPRLHRSHRNATIAALEQTDDWLCTFPNASVVLLQPQEHMSLTLLRNPVIQIGVGDLGRILCSFGEGYFFHRPCPLALASGWP